MLLPVTFRGTEETAGKWPAEDGEGQEEAAQKAAENGACRRIAANVIVMKRTGVSQQAPKYLYRLFSVREIRSFWQSVLSSTK